MISHYVNIESPLGLSQLSVLLLTLLLLSEEHFFMFLNVAGEEILPVYFHFGFGSRAMVALGLLI
jgi:hypothetical protein